MSLIMLTTSPLLISPVTSSWSMSESFFDIRLSKFLKKIYIKNFLIYESNIKTSINSTTFSLPLCLFNSLLFFSSRDIFRLMKTRSGPSISLQLYHHYIIIKYHFFFKTPHDIPPFFVQYDMSHSPVSPNSFSLHFDVSKVLGVKI